MGELLFFFYILPILYCCYTWGNMHKKGVKQFPCLCVEFIRKHKCREDDLDFSCFINFCLVDSDGYPMLAHAATAVTNGLCSLLNHPSTAYWLLTALQTLIQTRAKTEQPCLMTFLLLLPFLYLEDLFIYYCWRERRHNVSLFFIWKTHL